MFVTTEVRPDGVAVVTIDRAPLNALSRVVLEELRDAARSLAETPPGAVVITGAGRSFSAGAEIAEFEGPTEAKRISTSFHETLDAVASIPRFTIAAINGFALGGGCELALACDWRVASGDAQLGQPEVLLGIIPGGGATQRLPRLIGRHRAKELLTSGRRLNAAEALAIGLVDEIASSSALEFALGRAAKYARGAVVAQGHIKELVDAACACADRARGGQRETEQFAAIFETDDARIGLTSFREAGPGKAQFVGR